jgi:hypothetical protein
MNKEDVALILWNPDVIDLVAFALDRESLKSFGAEPSQETAALEQLIQSHDPSVVIFDLAPPYDRSAAVLLPLVNRFPSRFFIMTCADKALAIKKAPWLSARPLFQKPYAVAEVADMVSSVIRQPAAAMMSTAAT